ncbi:MAG TPA: cisplatin damage response ATP-dependent DNA ligase, partial [Rhizomicrobium sp.]|nr:cisplatin damage response ATP-dependent DNA ligase [Rhizomicrobium sp.]
MRAFANLLDRLSFTPQRNGKLALLCNFFCEARDPERGWALAALTGNLSFEAAKPSFIRKAVEARMDALLFALSYDYVGDLAETVALIWPAKPGANCEPELSEVVDALRNASRAQVQRLIEGWLDALDPDGRWALLKLLTGGLRVGVSARLAKQALADFGQVAITEIEDVWHSQHPPYEDLFAWLERHSEKPNAQTPGRFRPVMLAHAIDELDFDGLDPNDFAAEWKWDGIRVQAVRERGSVRLFSRTGDDIGKSFPDILDFLSFEGIIDGELLVMRDGSAAPFGDLQQRLNRKAADAAMLAKFPAAIRAYDLLLEDETDLRPLPFRERRQRLEAFVARANSPRIDLSPLISFSSWETLAAL